MRPFLLALVLTLLPGLVFADPSAVPGTINVSLTNNAGIRVPYCATNAIGNDYFGVEPGLCTLLPPGQDPNAYSRLNVSYNVNGQLRAVSNVDVRQFQNLFGRSTNVNTTIGYPFVNGSTIVINGQPLHYLRLRLNIPLNPGLAYHMIKGAANYSTPQNAEFKIQVVAPDGAWNSVPVGACRNDHGKFNYGVALTITPNPRDASASRCKTLPGTSWDVLIGMVDPSLRATQSYSWY